MTTATAPGRTSTSPGALAPPQPAKRRRMKSPYPTWFFIPAGVFYVVLFLVPTIASFYFSLTRWTLFDVEFIGFDNFVAVLPGAAAGARASSTPSSTRSSPRARRSCSASCSASS